MTCDSCSCQYKIGVEIQNPRANMRGDKHLCFKCGIDLVPTVLKTVKDRAVEKLVDNISSQIKALL
jgi:hypothetical protein